MSENGWDSSIQRYLTSMREFRFCLPSHTRLTLGTRLLRSIASNILVHMMFRMQNHSLSSYRNSIATN